MEHRLAYGLALVAAALVFSTAARAQCDVKFCTSKGYVAYEAYQVQQGLTERVAGHKLRLVRVEPNRGAYLAGEATLLDFNTYHLICSEARIEISGWRKVFTKYLIDILPSGEMKVFGPLEYPDIGWQEAAKDGPQPLNLDIFGPNEAPLTIESSDTEHEYQLLRNVSRKQSEGGNEFHIKSELVQIDKHGNELQRLVLHERTYIEPRD